MVGHTCEQRTAFVIVEKVGHFPVASFAQSVLGGRIDWAVAKFSFLNERQCGKFPAGACFIFGKFITKGVDILAARKTVAPTRHIFDDPPETLDGHPFYGLRLDEGQKNFRDTIWRGDKRIIFCNARAGSGKTLVAVATANLLVQYQLYSRIIYICAGGVYENRQGYLPGDLAQKSSLYSIPCVQALEKIGMNPTRTIVYDGLLGDTASDGYVYCMTDAFVRGVNLGSEDEKTIVIVEEAQNYTVQQLKTILTRVNDAGLTIVIGHDKQCDIKPEHSGFLKYIRHFSDSELAAYCELTECHRGKIADWADRLIS